MCAPTLCHLQRGLRGRGGPEPLTRPWAPRVDGNARGAAPMCSRQRRRHRKTKRLFCPAPRPGRREPRRAGFRNQAAEARAPPLSERPRCCQGDSTQISGRDSKALSSRAGARTEPAVGTVCFRAGMSAARFTYSFPLNSEETGSRCAEPTAPSGRLCSLANDDGASFPPSGRRRLSVSGHMVPLLVRDHEGPSVTRTGALSRGSWPHVLATLVPRALLLLPDGAPDKLISGQKVGSQTPS